MKRNLKRESAAERRISRLWNAFAPAPNMRTAGTPGLLRMGLLAAVAFGGLVCQLFYLWSRISGS